MPAMAEDVERPHLEAYLLSPKIGVKFIYAGNVGYDKCQQCSAYEHIAAGGMTL